MDDELLICPIDDIPMALLGMLDKKTRRKQYLCAECNKIYLGKKVKRTRRKKKDDKK